MLLSSVVISISHSISSECLNLVSDSICKTNLSWLIFILFYTAIVKGVSAKIARKIIGIAESKDGFIIKKC